MNTYIKPRNDRTRLMVIEQLHIKGSQDASEGITYIRPETLGQIGAFLPQFTTVYSNFQSHDAARMNAVAEATEALKAVARQIRSIWSAVKQRTKVGGLPVAVRLYYGLPANGKNPTVRNQHEWLVRGDQIVQGEAQAVAVGYPALLEPTVAELQLRLLTARTAVSQREAAKSAFESSATVLNNLRQEADALIATSMHQLRASLRTESAAARRDVMRTYGALFSQKTAETSHDAAMATSAVAAEMEEAVPAAMSLLQSYAVPAVNGNGTAVHV